MMGGQPLLRHCCARTRFLIFLWYMVSTIGLDLAKNVLQVHGIDVEGNVLVLRPLSRAEVLPFFAKLPPCLVDMEA